jgi:hypothetical protein
MKTDIALEAYLTPAQIARQLNVHPSAPVRWMRRGKVLSDGTRRYLEYLAIPGGYRVSASALDEFLAALTSDRMQGDNADDRPAPRSRLSTRRKQELARVDATLAREGF